MSLSNSLSSYDKSVPSLHHTSEYGATKKGHNDNGKMVVQCLYVNEGREH